MISRVSGAVLLMAGGSVAGSAAELACRTHWIGSTDGSVDAAVQTSVDALAVAADGTCYVSAADDETAVGIYRDGRMLGRCDPMPGVTRSEAIAVSDRYVFAAVRRADGSFGVARWTRDGRPAQPEDGGGAEFAAPIRGLCAHSGELFASDRLANRIRVFDAESMAERRGFEAREPGDLAVLADTLYVVESGGVVSAFRLDGRRTGQVIDEGFDPSALAAGADGRLLVADGGVRQQVVFYNVSGLPTAVREMGVAEGIFAPPRPGEPGPLRFAGLVGVGADATGRIVIACRPSGGGLVLRAFRNDRRTLEWEFFQPAAGGAAIDPAGDGGEIITANARFTIDYAKAPGASSAWAAHTVNPLRYPHDARAEAGALPPGEVSAYRIGDRQFLAWNYAHGFGLWRFEGLTAFPVMMMGTGRRSDASAPSGPVEAPDLPAWIWTDADADGQLDETEFRAMPISATEFRSGSVDARGDVWRVSTDGRIFRWASGREEPEGGPAFEAAPAEITAAPSPFARVLSIDFAAADDSLFIGGEASGGSEKASGPRLAVARYDRWSEPGGRLLVWEIATGASGAESLAAAGVLLFRAGADSVVHVHDARSGATIGSLPAVARGLGSIPSIRALRRSDGSYVVSVAGGGLRRIAVHHLPDPLRE